MRAKPVLHITMALALSAGCTLFSGWDDLQKGPAKDAGSTPGDDGSSGSSGSSSGRDSGPNRPDTGPFPTCPQQGSVDDDDCRCTGSCMVDCNLGGCVVVVAGGALGQTDCNGGGCEIECEPGGTCINTCNGGGCIFRCRAGSTCTNECIGKGCTFDCAPGACVNQ